MAEELVYWYSRCKGVSRMGTFRTQLEAWESVMSLDGTPAPEAAVWCESRQGNRGWERAKLAAERKKQG